MKEKNKTAVSKLQEEPKERKHQDFYLWGIVLGGLLFRFALLFHGRFVVSLDEAHYVRLAGSVYEQGINGLFHPYWPPFYPACIALFNLFVGNLEWAGRLVNVLSGGALILLVYRITLMLFRKKEALLSAGVVAFCPSLAWSSTSVMPETVFSLLGIGGLLTGWSAFNRKRWWLFGITGMLWGAAYLVKPEGVGFPMVYGLILGMSLFISGKLKNRLSTAGQGLVLIVGFLLLASSYLVFLHRTTGKWTPSTKGMVNQQMEAAVLSEPGGMKDPFFHLTADNRHLPYDMAYHLGNFQELLKISEGQERMVRISLFDFAKKFVINFYHLERSAVPQVLTLVFFILCTLGFFTTLTDRKRWLLSFYLLSYVAFFWFVLVPFFHVNERYLLPLFPLCLVWSGRGILMMHDWIVRGLKKLSVQMKRTTTSCLSAVILSAWILLFHFIPESAKVTAVQPDDPNMWAQPVELKEAGIWLKSRTARPPVLMSLNKAVDFYAGQYDMKKGASFSYDSIDRNIAYARTREVEYVVFSSRHLGWFSNLRPLLDNRIPASGLELIYDRTDPVGIRTVIYRLTPEFKFETNIK